MTFVTQFDACQDLVYIEGTIASATKQLEVRLVLDTGASRTLIVPDVIEKLGYSARDAETRTSITSAVGREHGYLLRVARFATLGFDGQLPGQRVRPRRARVDPGLVGMNFLRRFNYQVRSSEGRILVSNIAPLAAR